jgi:hypothetical protein
MNPSLRIPNVTFDITISVQECNKRQVIRRGNRNLIDSHLKCTKVKYLEITVKVKITFAKVFSPD